MKYLCCCFLLMLLVLCSLPAMARDRYEIEVSVNDEKFVINGELFEAKTYCFDMEEGDLVVFIEGSPNGVCVSAKFINLRNGNVCGVWCE